MTAAAADRPKISIRKGLISEPEAGLADLRLMGSKCADCGEVSLGTNALCLNCGSSATAAIPMSREGTLWTYTVVRHKPPGNYRVPDPFKPFGLGLVELPDGLRVMSPLIGDPESFHIGMKMRIEPRLLPGEDGADIVSFAFAPIA